MYKFDAQLVPNVLADRRFHRTGIYIGQDGDLIYAVIDPRRHVVNVWRKRLLPQGALWDPISHLTYQLTAVSLRAEWFTNGPQMDPPSGSGALNTLIGLIVGSHWVPFGPVIHGGRAIDTGKQLGQQFFGRLGQGRFTHYKIADDPPLHGFIEASGGMVQLVKAGGLVTSEYALNMQVAVGVATWGLRPINPPLDTSAWDAGYLEIREAEMIREPGMSQATFDELTYVNRDLPGWMLDGVLVSAASNQSGVNPVIAAQMLAVGCTDAIAADGSDSALAGVRNSIFVPCELHKDKIQRYGLACF